MKSCRSFSKGVFVAGISCALLCAAGAPASAATCTRITLDVGSGMTDNVFTGNVTALQSYLHDAGYMGAAPNGYFGPATFLAVKSFQASNGISATGYVGPLTRAAIAKRTCVSDTPQTAAPTPQPTAAVVVSDISDPEITSPAVGQAISLGSSIVIRWNKAPSDNFNLILEQPGGMGAGFVAQGISGSQYVWKTGQVFSSQTNTDQSAVAGTYRIRMQSTVGTASADETSGWFTNVAGQFSASSIVPSSVPADNSTSAVVFGSGFTSGTSVYFDADGSGIRASNSYVSSDGSVLVFKTPVIVPSGRHTVYIDSGSGTPVQLQFTVSALQ